MSQILIDTLSRGEFDLSDFPLAKEGGLRISYITVNTVTDRDAIAEWKRMAYMTVNVVADPTPANNKEYTLGSNTTIIGQVWTAKTYGVPDDVLVETDILDSEGFIKPQLIRNIFLNSSYVVDSQVAMLALTTNTGNFVIRTDESQIYVKLNDTNPASLGDFATTSNPGAVLTVNGDTGVVVITIDGLLEYGSNQTQFDAAITASPTIADHSASIAALQSDLSNLDSYVDTHIAGILVTGLVGTPTSSQNGYVLKYDNSSGRYDLAPDSVSTATLAGLSILGRSANSSGIMSAITGIDGQLLRVNGTTLGFGNNLTAVLKYTADLSGSYDDRTLVDKGYVDSVTGGSTIFTNGLTLDTGEVKLGGALIEDTVIDGDANSYKFELVNLFQFNIEASDQISLGAAGSLLTITSSEGIKLRPPGGNSYITLLEDNFTITSINPSFDGLKYSDDFSANYTDRTLVDKEYVDNLIFTFSNGLTETSGTVKIGGTLEEDTTINGDGSYKFIFTNLLEFNIDSSLITFNTSTTSRFVIDSSGNITLPNTETLIITGSSSFPGIQYATDYSANYTNDSLPAWKDVWKTFGSTVITDDFDITTALGKKVTITSTDGTGDLNVSTTIGPENFELLNSFIDGRTTRIFTSITGIILGVADDPITPGTYANIRFSLASPSEIIVEGGSSFPGMEYQDDYSPNYNNRSIVDKEYADNIISDVQLKENIRVIESSLDKLLRLKPSTFTMINNKEYLSGFVAQELEEVFPEFVNEKDNGFKQIRKDQLDAYIVKAIQELSIEINNIKNKLN